MAFRPMSRWRFRLHFLKLRIPREMRRHTNLKGQRGRGVRQLNFVEGPRLRVGLVRLSPQWKIVQAVFSLARPVSVAGRRF